MICSIRTFAPVVVVLLATAVCAADPFVMVVMDPLSKPLSCDCVRGYAQRDYRLLASHLESTLGSEVKVVWFESLAEALDETDGRADLVIGKHSVVVADMNATGYGLKPIAQLTGKDGDVNQKGLVVVRGDDSATTLRDLRGYRVLLGPAEAEEKSSAAEAALAAVGVELPEQRERRGACSEAATALLEFPPEVKAAAVISSYAEPLLEGCGSIKKDDLRVVGQTQPVPFVTALVSDELDPAMQKQVLLSLITAGTKPELLIGLETLAGFVPWSEPAEAAAVEKKKTVATTDR